MRGSAGWRFPELAGLHVICVSWLNCHASKQKRDVYVSSTSMGGHLVRERDDFAGNRCAVAAGFFRLLKKPWKIFRAQEIYTARKKNTGTPKAAPLFDFE